MQQSKIKILIENFLNKGTEYYDVEDDRLKVRQINMITFSAFTIVLPVVLIYVDLMPGELAGLVLLQFLLLISFVLNRNGKTQEGQLLALVGASVISYFLVYYSDMQVRAPLLNIIVAIGAVNILKGNRRKSAVLIFALLSYGITEYYNLKFKAFDEKEYFVIGAILVFLYTLLKFTDNENTRHKKEIIDKNEELEVQNKTIVKQTNHMIALETASYEQELLLKQKDIDTVLANHALQIRIKENIVEELETAYGKENRHKEIRSLILELKNQSEIEQKRNLLHGNMEEVNALLYKRLLEKHPDLTKTERELCTYIRIGLSTKEIVSLKNSTENTINVSKTRLRKKLELESNYDLGAYLLNF